jgi:hypothetical protein
MELQTIECYSVLVVVIVKFELLVFLIIFDTFIGAFLHLS